MPARSSSRRETRHSLRSACSLPHGSRTPARGGYARRFKGAARFRGEEEDVVFTCCFCCFQFRFASTRRMVESWLEHGCWMVGKWLSRSSEEWMNCDWEMAGYGWSADGAMQRERGTFASPLCLCRISAHQPGELPPCLLAKATSSAILRSGVLPLRSRTKATSREPTL